MLLDQDDKDLKRERIEELEEETCFSYSHRHIKEIVNEA